MSTKQPEQIQEPQCRSMTKTFLRKEGVTIYLRCKKGDDHPGQWHESWMKKWKDEDEVGFLEDEYPEDLM